MSPAPGTPSQPPPPSGSEDQPVLDLLLGGLSPQQAAALEARLAADPRLQAERRTLEGLRAALRPLRDATPSAGCAQRIALRVRDQVGQEERRARRQAPGGPFGLSVRARVRLLLASVAVHVIALGWLVFREPSHPRPAPASPVDVAVVPPAERPQPEPGERFEALDLGPVVGAEQVPDQVLVDVGWVEDAPPAPFRIAEHPQPVQLEMLARSRASVRSQRLARAGTTVGEATAVVRRGLDALARLQREDGSFPRDLTLPAEQASPLGVAGRTALAILPFLAEGRRSAADAAGAQDPVVARAIAWLRGGGAGGQAEQGPDDLALRIVALSEDYMLSYGRLPPAETTERGREIARLVARLAGLQRPDGTFGANPGGDRSLLWPLLALDAVRHTGLAVDHAQAGERLQAWIAAQPRTSEGLPRAAGGGADAALAAAEVLASRLPLEAARQRAAEEAIVGRAQQPGADVGTLAGALALYRSDASSFERWNRAASEALLRQVGPQGLVTRGEAVVDTALVLLALQAAYRLY